MRTSVWQAPHSPLSPMCGASRRACMSRAWREGAAIISAGCRLRRTSLMCEVSAPLPASGSGWVAVWHTMQLTPSSSAVVSCTLGSGVTAPVRVPSGLWQDSHQRPFSSPETNPACEAVTFSSTEAS